MLSLRKFKGKRLVSSLRNGDYSHPGETESIDLVMSLIQKNKHCKILDVGCGLGGTANYLYENNYGQIYGLDIESESIEYAKKKYKNVIFECGDVSKANSIFNGIKFDVIILFNSFYAFSDQKAALNSLHECAKNNTQLLLFDYSLANDQKVYQWITPSSFIPIVVTKIEALLRETGWRLIEKKDVSEQYYDWYDDLCKKHEKNKDYIIREFGQDEFNESLRVYSSILNDLSKNDLGGYIIRAEYLDQRESLSTLT